MIKANRNLLIELMALIITKWRLESARAVSRGDDIESAVDVGLRHAARLRPVSLSGEAVLRYAFEGRM
jgi:hypothetical protein